MILQFPTIREGQGQHEWMVPQKVVLEVEVPEMDQVVERPIVAVGAIRLDTTAQHVPRIKVGRLHMSYHNVSKT